MTLLPGTSDMDLSSETSGSLKDTEISFVIKHLRGHISSPGPFQKLPHCIRSQTQGQHHIHNKSSQTRTAHCGFSIISSTQLTRLNCESRVCPHKCRQTKHEKTQTSKHTKERYVESETAITGCPKTFKQRRKSCPWRCSGEW